MLSTKPGKFIFAEPLNRRGNRGGNPSNIPPQDLLAFASGITWPTLADIPWNCGCTHVPRYGRWWLKFRWRACPVHWY